MTVEYFLSLVHPAPATVRAMTPPTQAPVVSKPATVTIQSQHVITYSDNVANPTVVIPKEQTVVIPHEPTMVTPHEPAMVIQHEPTMVLQGPEVTVLDEPTMVLSGPEVTVLDEPTMVLSGPEVTVHHRNDDAR